MPAFAHSLRDTTLGDVLAYLSRTHADGVLELDASGARHEVHLRRGRVQAVACADTTARVGDLAVDAGALRDAIESACDLARETNWRAGRAFVHRGLVSPRALDALLARQRADRLARLYALADARLFFRAPVALPHGTAEQRPLDPHETFHGRPRARGVTPSPERARAFATIGVACDATESQVRHAFRALVFELHPDRARDATSAERDARARRLLDVLAAHRSLNPR